MDDFLRRVASRVDKKRRKISEPKVAKEIKSRKEDKENSTNDDKYNEETLIFNERLAVEDEDIELYLNTNCKLTMQNFLLKY